MKNKLILKPGQIIDKFTVNGKEVVFRTPTMADAHECMAHINKLAHEKAFLSNQKKLTLAGERKWLKERIDRLKRGNEISVMVTVNGKFAGNGQVVKGALEAKAHVATLGIALSSHRGMGIGGRLMETLEKLAKTHFDAKLVELTCFECNTNALKFYAKLGFSEAGRIPGGVRHYGKFMDEIVFYKRLKK